MSAGRILTLGLGTPFSAKGFLPTLGLGTAGTPPTPPAPTAPVEQASNWQANYWRHKSKADRENEEMLERIRLGILPAPLQAEALQAVREADEASRALAAKEVTPENAIAVAMQSRAAYDDVYLRAYKDAYIAEAVAERWKEDMKRITRRRKAIALLLN